jgi:hypothetical protein
MVEGSWDSFVHKAFSLNIYPENSLWKHKSAKGMQCATTFNKLMLEKDSSVASFVHLVQEDSMPY